MQRQVRVSMSILLAGALLALPACSTTRGWDQATLDETIANARSAEDHDAISSYFQNQARALDDKIEAHRKMAHVYASRSAWAEEFRVRQASHCIAAAERLSELMWTYEELAREHGGEARKLR
jgi:hypothetical protein